MFSLHKILIPVKLAETFASTSRHLIRQTAWLAHHFHAEIMLLHAVTPFSYPFGWVESGDQITTRDSDTHVIQQAQNALDRIPLPEFDGIAVTRLLVRGQPAHEIVKTVSERNADLIVMATCGSGRTLAKVLRETQCPVWTGSHLEGAGHGEFSIRRVLCSVELNGHSRHTVALAAAMAAALNATLTLVHITNTVEVYGPGGSHVDPALKKQTVGFAAEDIAKLQEDVGTNAEVIIRSGDVLESLNQVAQQSNADVLVIGHIPGRSHLGDNSNGHEIIRRSLVPVLSV